MIHIMIIEDDNSMRALLKILLEIERFQVSAPESQDEQFLISRINESKPDIVLMDVNLKKLNGLDFIKTIRNNPGWHQPRVIMSSGEDFRDNYQDAGADYFLLKPYMPTELISLLHALV